MMDIYELIQHAEVEVIDNLIRSPHALSNKWMERYRLSDRLEAITEEAEHRVKRMPYQRVIQLAEDHLNASCKRLSDREIIADIFGTIDAITGTKKAA